jgi:uncharacterized protein
VHIEFDPAKSGKNLEECGLSFADAALLFDGPRLEWKDRRKDYGEIWINTLGEIEGRIFFVAFTRRGEAIRIISFRKANSREIERYRGQFRAGGED